MEIGSGAVITYGAVQIYNASVLQECIALSSAEAKLVALSEATKKIDWLKTVLSEFGIKQKSTVPYLNNNGIIARATGNLGSLFAKRKHAELRQNK